MKSGQFYEDKDGTIYALMKVTKKEIKAYSWHNGSYEGVIKLNKKDVFQMELIS